MSRIESPQTVLPLSILLAIALLVSFIRPVEEQSVLRSSVSEYSKYSPQISREVIYLGGPFHGNVEGLIDFAVFNGFRLPPLLTQP